MNGQAVSTIPIEKFKSTRQVSDIVARAPEGLYVTLGGVAQFVALPVDRYERMYAQQRRLLLREQYIRSLVDQGYASTDLQRLLPQLDDADKAWLADSTTARTTLLHDAQASFRHYLLEQGADEETLAEGEVDDLIDALIQQVRQETHAA